MGQVSALSEKLNCEVIAADATNVEDLENVFKRSMEVLGGQIDFVLHSIGMSPNVRKKRTYDDLDYNMLNTTLDVSAVSFHKMIQAAKKQNAIAEYGSIVALSYVAAQRTFYGYNDMADAKALLESIARSFGYIYGREHNVRVNTISQSPTFTTAGSGVKGMDKLYDFANRMSPLGNASADECADYCIVMFSDLTRKVTMQNLFHDGGFSSVGRVFGRWLLTKRVWTNIKTKTVISFTVKAMKIRKNYILLVLLSLLFASCRVGKAEPVADPMEEEGISVVRYDKLLDEYVRFNSFSALQKMNLEYSLPTKLLIEDVLAIGQVSDDHIFQRLKTFYSDTTLIRLIEDVETRYPELGSVEKELTKGFGKLQKEVPDIMIPMIYTQISAFNESIVLSDSVLGISLDKYMGEDYPLYKRFYYGYQRRTMRPDRIVPDCLVYYLMSQYPFPMDYSRTLLDVMMHFGKINYVVQHLLDYSSSEEALGYSDVEREWCKENQQQMWRYILEKDHLHATDPMVVRQYTRPAPFTNTLGENAPSMVGTWIGTKIITSYMKHHKKTTLRQLLEMNDYERMFTESRFNP